VPWNMLATMRRSSRSGLVGNSEEARGYTEQGLTPQEENGTFGTDVVVPRQRT
jgi:hypothetical protein